MKHTHEEHPDYPDIQRALEKVRVIQFCMACTGRPRCLQAMQITIAGQYVNERQREFEAVFRVIEIDDIFRKQVLELETGFKVCTLGCPVAQEVDSSP